MIVGDDVSGGVINDAGTAAALDQHPPVEKITDIGFVGDADNGRADDLGRPHDGSVARRRQLRPGCRCGDLLLDLRDRIRNRLAHKKRSVTQHQAAADHCAQDRDDE